MDNHFPVHRNLIMKHSRPIAKIVTQARRGSDGSCKITLHDADPDAFGMLLNWMYFKKVGKAGEVTRIPMLISIWELGERFGIPALQNAIMNLLIPRVEQATVVRSFLLDWFRRQVLFGVLLTYHPVSQVHSIRI